MLTKDDLKAIAQLIKAEGNAIRKDMTTKSDIEAVRRDMVTKRDLEASNRIMGQIFKIELAATRKEMTEAMKAGFREVVKILGEFSEENHEEKIKGLENRVRRFEKQQAFRT